MWAINWVPALLTFPGDYDGLDIAPSGAPLDIEAAMPDGKTVNVSVRSASVETQPERESFFDHSHNGHQPPRWWTQEEPPLTFEYRKNERTVYAIFAAVEDDKNKKLSALARELFDFVNANKAQKLIIDVRNNGGGDNTLLAPLIDGARQSSLNHPGGLFVLIGRQTFSAGQNFVNRMEKDTDALFVGEPTGESPNQYGDPEIYSLPHTRLPVLISTRRWEDSVPEDHRKWTAPDIPARYTFRDYIDGTDPAIEAALHFDASKIAHKPDPSAHWDRPSQRAAWAPPLPVE